MNEEATQPQVDLVTESAPSSAPATASAPSNERLQQLNKQLERAKCPNCGFDKAQYDALIAAKNS